jgi:hypothetical protein
MKECVPSYLLKKIIYVDKSLVEGVVIKWIRSEDSFMKLCR